MFYIILSTTFYKILYIFILFVSSILLFFQKHPQSSLVLLVFRKNMGTQVLSYLERLQKIYFYSHRSSKRIKKMLVSQIISIYDTNIFLEILA